jgi:hypothetical protein
MARLVYRDVASLGDAGKDNSDIEVGVSRGRRDCRPADRS